MAKSDLKKLMYERITLRASQNSSLDFIPGWLEKNTKHPLDSTKPWSFDGHEFQIDILKSTAHRQTCKKISQAGISEIAARKALALAALRQGVQLIYTLPTGAFAQMFSKTRVDPVIENSEVLMALVDPDTNNTRLKRLGSSFIHFIGTFSEGAPISIPATYVISDETDFSDQSVLTAFNSRLGHQKESESFNIKFSTPSVEGYSISDDYEHSSKGRYAVKCMGCNSWQIPSFLDNVVIPNTEKPLAEINRYDVASMNPEVLEASYVACPSCNKNLTESLLDKYRRQWVHAHPSRQADHEGFHVVPFDVPTINTVCRTLRQILDYRHISTWYNFKLGETYSDDTTKFNLETITKNTTIRCPDRANSTVVGVDVGKVSWISIGIPYIGGVTDDLERLDIIKLIKVDTTLLKGGDSLGQEVIRVAERYNASVVVVDAAPDFTTAQHVHKTYFRGKAYGNYYVNENSFSKTMSYWKVDDRKGVCISARSSSLDDLCDMVNSGSINFPICDEMTDVKKHFDAVKRVAYGDGDNTKQVQWVSREKAEDHWVHSINYLHIAAQISNGSGGHSGFEVIPSLSAITLKGGDNIKF